MSEVKKNNKLTDFNDLHLVAGLDVVGRQLDAALSTGDIEIPSNNAPPNISQTFKFRSIGEVLSDSIKPDWLIKPVIEKRSLIVVFGESESGKSLVVNDLSLCVGCNIGWHGMKVKTGPVVWIISEGYGGVPRRLKAWSIHHGIDLSDKLIFISCTPAEFFDELSASSVQLEIEKIQKQLGQPPALIIIDTLAGNFGPGNESFPSDMSRFVNNINFFLKDHFGAAVLVIHHSGHADKDRHRGAGSLKAAADTEYKVSKSSEGIVRFECTKMKDAAYPDPLAFEIEEVDLGELDEDGEPITSVILALAEYQVSSSSERSGLGGNQKRAIAILQRMYSDHRSNLEAGGRDPAGARVELGDWRDALLKENVLHGKAVNQQFYKLKVRLQERALISIKEPFVYIQE